MTLDQLASQSNLCQKDCCDDKVEAERVRCVSVRGKASKYIYVYKLPPFSIFSGYSLTTAMQHNVLMDLTWRE